MFVLFQNSPGGILRLPFTDDVEDDQGFFNLLGVEVVYLAVFDNFAVVFVFRMVVGTTAVAVEKVVDVWFFFA